MLVDDSWAVMRAWSKFGTAIAAMVSITAKTMSTSIGDNSTCLFPRICALRSG